MWGVDGWSPKERAQRFAEYVELVDRLAREDDVTHAGAFYRTTGAIMQPWFVQKSAPPFTLAAHGPTTMKVAARYADTWNTYGPSLDSAREEVRGSNAAAPRSDEILTRSVGRRSLV